MTLQLSKLTSKTHCNFIPKSQYQNLQNTLNEINWDELSAMNDVEKFTLLCNDDKILIGIGIYKLVASAYSL